MIPSACFSDTSRTCHPSRAAKVNLVNLPQEHALARFISDLLNTARSWSTRTPACSWEGVRCDDDGKVSDIYWDRRVLSGVLHFIDLPSSLVTFSVETNTISGEVALNKLPFDLHSFNLHNNKFYGSLDLISLPQHMERLCLSNNEFTGHVCLNQLPTPLEYLALASNSLTGPVDLTSLPDNMQYLSIRDNRFSGVIDLSSLPESLTCFYLFNNQDLSGHIKHSQIPTSICNSFTVKNTLITLTH